MQAIEQTLRSRVRALLEEGVAERVLGWRPGDFEEDLTPGTFAQADQLCYNEYCAANLSKYLITLSARLRGRTLVLLKPCDSENLALLEAENRIERDAVYALGVPCHGMRGRDGEILTRCRACRKQHGSACDEVLDDTGAVRPEEEDRFARVREIESMPPAERFAFWQGQLRKCIRCNACRNACPACTCIQCVFDNPASGVAGKCSPDDFEDQCFHIIRAFHVAGRCTDCGECSRVCPQGIPLHLLNRKLIQDMGAWYGGEGGALTRYAQGDPEPDEVLKGGCGS